MGEGGDLGLVTCGLTPKKNQIVSTRVPRANAAVLDHHTLLDNRYIPRKAEQYSTRTYGHILPRICLVTCHRGPD